MLNPVTAEFISQLQRHLPAAAFPGLGDKYLAEPRGYYRGSAGLLVAPDSTAQVAQVIAAAAAARIGVVPYGGGTGLVGGQILPGSTTDAPAPLILSLGRMRRIRACYPAENVLVAEAGAVLAEVQQSAADVDRLFPLSLASEGSAQIGGLLATNAGGVNVLRYGMARDQVLGIEAVMADGRIFNGLQRLRKDNTGYDLRHLLIGSEGALGIITAASLKLAPRPQSEGTALLAVDSPSAALDLLGRAKGILGESISAFELISGQGLRFLAETHPQMRQPWSSPPDWSILLHLGVSNGAGAEQAIETLFEQASDMIRDGVIAQSAQQAQDLWSLRETIPLANRAIGAICSSDISLPLSEIASFIAKMPVALARYGDIRINCFGHLGDGNLHYNLFPAAGAAASDYRAMRADLQAEVHRLTHELGGSVSAEHGVGLLKKPFLHYSRSAAEIATMKAIKKVFDPKNIMNPGKLFD